MRLFPYLIIHFKKRTQLAILAESKERACQIALSVGYYPTRSTCGRVYQQRWGEYPIQMMWRKSLRHLGKRGYMEMSVDAKRWHEEEKSYRFVSCSMLSRKEKIAQLI